MTKITNIRVISALLLAILGIHADAKSYTYNRFNAGLIIYEDSIQPGKDQFITIPVAPDGPDLPQIPIDPDYPDDPVFPPDTDEDIPTIDDENQYSVGTPKGTLDVNSMGAAVYNVGIECPNGGTLMPSISLSYNSQAGWGLAGYGFNIGSLSAITRGGSNMYNDGALRGITYTNADNLLLDGKRLILQSGTHFCDGAVYTVEGDPYTTVIIHGTYSDTNVGTWFEVHAKDGTI